MHDVTEPNVDDLWQAALDESVTLSDAADVTSDDCVGGTSEELQVLDDESQVVIDVFVDHCDSSKGPDLNAVVSELLTLFDLDTLLATE